MGLTGEKSVIHSGATMISVVVGSSTKFGGIHPTKFRWPGQIHNHVRLPNHTFTSRSPFKSTLFRGVTFEEIISKMKSKKFSSLNFHC
jgi:hypothetical protein